MSWQKDILRAIKNSAYSYSLDIDEADDRNIEAAVDTLEIRDSYILRRIFKDGAKQREIAAEIGISTGRISELKGKTFRRLKTPYRLNIVKYGKEEADRIMIEKEARKKKEERLAPLTPEITEPIERLEGLISARSYNSLKRYVKKIEDIAKMSVGDLYELRNIGQNSVNEIVGFMAINYGIVIK